LDHLDRPEREAPCFSFSVPRTVASFGFGPPLRNRRDEAPAPSADVVADMADDAVPVTAGLGGITGGVFDIEGHGVLSGSVLRDYLGPRPACRENACFRESGDPTYRRQAEESVRPLRLDPSNPGEEERAHHTRDEARTCVRQDRKT